MGLFGDIFSGVDFTDFGVQFFSIVFVAAIFLMVLLIFFSFKIFIPKSKMQDVETIDKAIIRLEKLMLFDRIVLILSTSIVIIIAILHFTKAIDVFQLPFPLSMGIMFNISIIPIFFSAVFGRHGRLSPNQRKLDDLRRLRK